MYVFYFILFIIILHAPLLWSNTTCIVGFLHVCMFLFFDVEYIYGFVMLGGFVRQVDDVIVQPFQRTVTPARATP